MKRVLISTAITLAIGAVIAFGLSCFLGGLSADTGEGKLKAFCDGFLVVGILMLGSGVIAWVNNMGGNTGIAFMLRSVGNRVKGFFVRDRQAPKKYKDYLDEHDEAPKKMVAHILLSGLVLFVTALILTIVYSQLYP